MPEHTLSELIDMQIRANGPMSIATYMSLCLTHPREGYYKNAQPIGAAGDFITAPEISQMFGEMIGFYLVNLWQQLGEPKAFTLLELGPGRATLMADILRVAARAPGFIEALDLALYETHPGLIEIQRTKLAGARPHWVENFDCEGDTPLLVIANEFFDALPIRQFVRTGTGWNERMVGLDAEGKRYFGLSPVTLPANAVPPEVADAEEGAVYEAHLATRQVITQLGQALARRTGALLAIDYGYGFTQPGETLQAVARHARADPLEAPGAADISTHVDFGAISLAASEAGLSVNPVTDQGEFLLNLGMGARAQALIKANPRQTETIRLALDRLTGADQMGTLFKVFAANSPGLQPEGMAK